MIRISIPQIFLATNALIGLAVGTAAARSQQFAALGVPNFAWLVGGMLALEVLAGLALKAHPSNLISMALRIAALVASFAVCYITLEVLGPQEP